MSTQPKQRGSLSDREERRWFRVWVLALIAFFVVTGGLLARFQWLTKLKQRREHRQLMDPATPDPGLTSAAPSSTEAATAVEAGLYLERVPELSTRNASWTAVFDVWFRWRGNLQPASSLVVLEGSIESREKLAELHSGGFHYERHRMVAKITKPFEVTHFPLDEHLLVLALENGDMVRETMVFVPDRENTSVSSRVSVPGYRITEWRVIEKPHSYKTTRGDPRLRRGAKSTYSQLRLGIKIERRDMGLYFKMFQALYVAVAIALLACFIKPTDLDPRFGLGVGALFAAVANAYIVGSFVPDTGDVALADLVNGLGILTILVTLIESTVSLYVYDRCGEVKLSERLDRFSFIIMLSGFTVANVAMVLPKLL